MADSKPKVCKGCGMKHLMETGDGEYTCYTCGTIHKVKTSSQKQLS